MGLVQVFCSRCQADFQAEAGREAPHCPSCGTPAPPAWYCARGKQKVGPFSLAQLRQMAAAGQLAAGDMVLQVGGSRWSPAGSIPELFSQQETVSHHPGSASGETGPEISAPPAPLAVPLPAVAGHDILEVLGRGGMGVVYKARHVRLKRLVALKMIRGAEHAGEHELARFKAEAEAVARLQHANIVQIHEVGEQNGQPFFSLEYVDGGSLAKKLAGGPLPARQAAGLVETLARAMHAAYERGIIHRDLKPANVLMAGDGTPKIADFGLAKKLEDGDGQTQTGAVMGTPSYMAPEQASGSKEIGPGVDVYALGAILYECLTSRPPFKAPTVLETIEQVLHRDPVPPAQLQPKVPRDLETICLKCLEKDRSRRYGSAGELADDLGRYLSDQPIQARPASLAYRFRKFTARRKAVVLGSAATLLMLVLAVIGTTTGMVGANWARDQAEKANDKTSQALAEKQRALANSQAAQAALEAQRGHWAEALALYDEALQLGPDDAVAVELGRLDCYGALLQTDRLQAALDALAARTDLGSHRGAVLLARARYALVRPDDKADDSVDLLRQALKAGLGEADEQYARAMLATTVPEAVEHLQRAADKGRFDSGVLDMLVPLLVLLGRLDEARDYVARFKLISPDSVTLRFQEGLLYALQDDMPRANARLAELEGTSAAAASQARPIYELVRRFARGDYQWQTIGVGDVMKMLSGSESLTGGDLGSGLKKMMQLPFLRELFKQLTSAALASATGRQAARTEALAAVLRIAPDGMVYFAYGQALRADGRLDEAEQALSKAAGRRSLFETRQRARYELFNLHLERQTGSGQMPDEARRRQLVAELKQVVAMGPVPAEVANDIAASFLLLREPAQALVVLEERQRLGPPDLTALQLRAMTEWGLGSLPRVLATCGEILRRDPNNRRAANYQRMAQQAIKSLQGGTAPPAPGKP